MKATAERRHNILLYLCKTRFDTLNHLAVEFNVSKKTIQRDIELISGFAPLYTIPGKGGGIYIMDKYCLTQKYLNREQEELLQSLIEVLPAEKQKVIISILDTFSMPTSK